MINQCDKHFMVYSKTSACTCERLSSHSSRDFWLWCWKDRSSGICSKLHASRVTILEFLAKISCNSRENSRVIPASSTQNPCEFWGFVAWKNWNIHAGYLKIRSFPTMVLWPIVFLLQISFEYLNIMLKTDSVFWLNFEQFRLKGKKCTNFKYVQIHTFWHSNVSWAYLQDQTCRNQ